MISSTPQTLKWDHGPISFGNLVAGAVVSWSADSSLDLLLSRCWRGVYLYRSRSLSDSELCGEPIKVCDNLVYLTRAYPIDWNRDGSDDLLLTDRPGFLYRAERRGSYPDISFPTAEPLRDHESGLVFNVPFENPNYSAPDDQGGYLDPDFFCYVYPQLYRLAGDPGFHLILGDAAGNLWWLRDESAGAGEVRYTGVAYEKTGKSMSYGGRYRRRYGTTFVKPAHKLHAPSGAPILLGEAFEGYRDERGGNCKPVVLPSDGGGDADLLVLTTGRTAEILHLARVGTDRMGAPVFDNRGPVELELFDPKTVGFHSPIMLTPHDGGRTMLLATSSGLALLRRVSRSRDDRLRYRLDRYVFGYDVPAALYGVTEILRGEDGARFLLDNPGTFRMYPLRGASDHLRVGYDYLEIRDREGVLKPEGVTDVRSAPEWGVHRAVRWRFDPARVERRDLIVGVDTGHLYLLIASAHGPAAYERMGPLRDTAGTVIKIHNRVFPAPIDYRRSGAEDLLLVGTNYQMGIAPDPNPGAGFYVCAHDGLRDGLPLLRPPVSIRFEGFVPSVRMNQNPHIQTVDIDGDGEKEAVIATPDDGWKGRIYRVAPDGGGLVYSGAYVPDFRLHQRFLDIDDDGALERVFAGGETGIGRYGPVEIVHDR